MQDSLGNIDDSMLLKNDEIEATSRFDEQQLFLENTI